MRLFQVGDIRLHARFAPNDQYDYVVKRKVESPTASTNMAWSPLKITGFGGYNLKTDDISFTELLLNTEEQTQSQRYNQYLSLTSRPYVDVIAYEYLSERDAELTGNMEAAYDAGLIWFHTTGSVKTVDKDEKNNTMSIGMELQTEWEPINRYLWKFNNYLMPYQVSDPAITPFYDIQSLPTTMDLLRNGLEGYWSKRFYSDGFYMYNPDVWANWHLHLPPSIPTTGIGDTWNYNYYYSFTAPSEIWPGLTRSLYQFAILPTSGSLIINVTNQEPIFGTRTYTNVLSLSVLNYQMNQLGYGDLLISDRLIIDNYRGYRSFILRDSAILEGVFPRWTYDGELLGQTGKGLNRIQVTPPNTNVAQAYLHCFRVV